MMEFTIYVRKKSTQKPYVWAGYYCPVPTALTSSSMNCNLQRDQKDPKIKTVINDKNVFLSLYIVLGS